jgi:acetolactate decarboxylase
MGCKDQKEVESSKEVTAVSTIQVVSAMREVMYSGTLEGKINLDTIAPRLGLQGLGPESFLTGEIMIIDGESYVSRVDTDTTMTVEKTYKTSAPFFVYDHVEEWTAMKVPDSITNIKQLEQFVDRVSTDLIRPFAFKVSGQVQSAVIHIQNLPPGTSVSSPKEAHIGQINYDLGNEHLDILGFFSTQHKAVFTHHDTFIHLHAITANREKMGHLDAAQFDAITLYLPQQ